MKYATIRTTCRLCDAPLDLVLDIGETPLANELKSTREESLAQDRFPLRLCRCTRESCGHVQLDCIVDGARLYGPDYPYRSGLTEGYREHLRDYAGEVGQGLNSGDLVVEVGGNDGCFADFLHTDTFHINVDPSGTENLRYGMELWRQPFTLDVAKRIKASHGPARAIVANHCFAHIDDLHDVAEGMRELLHDDGTVWIEVGHGPVQLNRGCLDVIYHEHMSYWDSLALQRFMAGHGLLMTACHWVPAQGGSLRATFNRSDSDIWSRHHVEFDLMAIKRHAEHLIGFGEMLYKVNRNIRYPVGLCGCPAKATTLMRLMDFYPDLAFDNSGRKIGRFLPGTATEIRPQEQLNLCDSALVASWNFAAEIIGSHADYPGTWIVPLPNVRFVRGRA